MVSAPQLDEGLINPRRGSVLLVLFRWISLIPSLVSFLIAAGSGEASGQLAATLSGAVVLNGMITVLHGPLNWDLLRHPWLLGEAKTGREAVAKPAVLAPDLVLLDWKMPEMDRLAAAEASHRTTQTRSLLLSDVTINDAALDALDQGVNGFVHSPLGDCVLIGRTRVRCIFANHTGRIILRGGMSGTLFRIKSSWPLPSLLVLFR
jgi:CheY-like chemotaxis protein